MVPTASTLSAITAVSSVLGLLSLLAYLFLVLLLQRQKASLRATVEGDGLIQDSQVIPILSQFTDDDARLAALRALTQHDEQKARELLLKIKDNVDVALLTRLTQGASLRVAALSATFFLGLAGIGLISGLSRRGPNSRPAPSASATPVPSPTPVAVPRTEAPGGSEAGSHESSSWQNAHPERGNAVAAERVVIISDLTDAYLDTGRKLGFLENWGGPATRHTLRVNQGVITGTAPDGRVVSMSIDPKLLPVPIHYNEYLRRSPTLPANEAALVGQFFSSYGQFREALANLASGAGSLSTALLEVTLSARECISRGRVALCAMGIAPPAMFPAGGFPEPFPPGCDTTRPLP